MDGQRAAQAVLQRGSVYGGRDQDRAARGPGQRGAQLGQPLRCQGQEGQEGNRPSQRTGPGEGQIATEDNERDRRRG